MLLALCAAVGCAKYNTYFNAKRAFDNAEHIRNEAIRKHLDAPTPTGAQKSDYELAIHKAQKILDEYPGHSLTDDALFLQGKAYFRIESHRMSIRRFDLLFANYPATPYLEEAIYLQALNYLLLGALERSQEYLDQLERQFPESRFQAETRRVSGDNAFALEDWEAAAIAYREYLGLNVDADERDRIGLKLAECYWELARYDEADRLLAGIIEQTASAELSFRARLLRTRAKVRLGDVEAARDMVSLLRDEAEIYQARGELGLTEAEALVAEGKPRDAVTLLQGMPADGQSAVIKAKVADLLGYLLLERGEFENAKAKFQAALVQRIHLEDPDRTRRLSDSLKDYLAAARDLPDAEGARVPRLKLLQANAMLFGFDRPAAAADLYWQAASDTAADSTLAARALYGAYVSYGRRPDRADSAAVAASLLVDRYPESPQAYEVRTGQGADLLGYLLEQRTRVQQANLANLTDEERTALESVLRPEVATASPQSGLPRFRRQQVYLSRRANLVFSPPAEAMRAGPAGDGRDPAQEAARASPDAAAAESTAVPQNQDRTGVPLDPQGLRTAAPDSTARDDDATDAETREKTREQEENWDFLRSPAPGGEP